MPEPSRNAASTGLDPRQGPATISRGPLLVVLRIAWSALALLALVPATVSFVRLIQQGSLEILVRAGAFAINPKMLSGLESLGLDHDVILRADLLFRLSGMLAFGATAIVIFVRKSDDWMTALVSFMLISGGATWFAPLGVLPRGSVLHSLAGLVGVAQPFDIGLGRSLAGLSIILFLFLFPNGRFVPTWTRYAAGIIGLHFVLWVAFPGSPVDARLWPGAAKALAVAVVVGTGMGAQLYRYFFVSSPLQKQQTKLVVGAQIGVAVVPVLLFILNPGLGSGLEDLTLVTPRVQALYNLVLLLVLGAALFVVPVSIGISVLRYRLWDIDIFINRTLVYGALTGILGLAYFVVVAVISGIADMSWLTAAVATLAVAALFQPLRRRLQDLIDRQFFRSRYDAIKTLDSFSSRLREQIDLETLTQELLKVVEQTMKPVGVSLWIPRNPDGVLTPDAEAMHRLGFWIAGNVRGGDFTEISLDEASMTMLREADGPIDLVEPSITPDALCRFRDVNVRLAVPLVNQGELVGMMGLGPRLSDTDYSSEDHRLLANLADHAAAAVRVALLVREHEVDMRARERMDNEMHVARLIQQQFISKRLPDVQGWKLWTHYSPAREVGGDFYDVIELTDGRICVVAGDVTGKGVPAALVMASTRSLIRSEAPRCEDPAQILSIVNEQLLQDIPEQMFVTCLCVILDPANGEMVYANAGHNLPYLRTEAGVEEVRATGMPLGLMPGIRYEASSTTLLPGETMVLHSDGLAEARNTEKEMFGFPRLKAMVERASSPATMIGSLMRDLAEFTGEDWEQDDDITLVVLHREGLAPPPRRRRPAKQQADTAVAPATSRN